VTSVQVTAPNPARLGWRRLGPALAWQGEIGEGAVYDPASGETHFLSPLPALLLSAIDGQWAFYSEIVDRIAGPVDYDGQAEAQIIAALVVLERAELVELQALPAE